MFGVLDLTSEITLPMGFDGATGGTDSAIGQCCVENRDDLNKRNHGGQVAALAL
jgi:hypothetical protein